MRCNPSPPKLVGKTQEELNSLTNRWRTDVVGHEFQQDIKDLQAAGQEQLHRQHHKLLLNRVLGSGVGWRVRTVVSSGSRYGYGVLWGDSPGG